MSELTLKRRRSGAVSGAERITGVKNAQADVMLLKRKQHFDFLFKKKEQDIQIEEHRLENENKLLNLECKRNELEYKRRLFPDADLSNDEMTVNNLQKYLVRNAGKLNYTDKSVENKVRTKCSTESVPPIVAEARTTITKKELIRAVEKNRKHMYKFLDKPVSRQNKRTTQGEEMDEFEMIVRENKLPGFAGHLMPDKQLTTKERDAHKHGSNHLSLPAVPERTTPRKPKTPGKQTTPNTVKLVIPRGEREKQELHKKLKDNPVIKEAVDAHHKDKEQYDYMKPSQSVATVLSRMSRMKPPTKTQVQEELDIVQSQVGAFCERIEGLLWDYKEEQFRQGIKFVKDKDTAWNKFMETMQKRSRGNNEKDEPEQPFIPQAPKSRRPTTSIHTELTALTEKRREQIMMENLMVGKERLVESAPTRKRGIPHHTVQRSFHHSPRAKLQRMLEKNKNILEAVVQASQDKQETGAAELSVLTKLSQVTAK